MKPTHKDIHICNSHFPTLHQKLQKSMTLANADREKEIKKPVYNNVYNA